MSGVDRCNAILADDLYQFFLGVIGICGAQFRLERSSAIESHLIVRLVEVAVQSDDRMCVDQAGRDDLGRDHAIISRYRYRSRWPDRRDLAVVD